MCRQTDHSAAKKKTVHKSHPRWLIPAILGLVLALAACAGTPEPTPPLLSTATAPVPALTGATATPLPTEVVPSATPLARTTTLDAEPTPLPPSPAPPLPTPSTSTLPSATSPWPRFLRELNFGIPAGNSYGPRALAIHPGLGRLYARTHANTLEASQTGLLTMLDLDSGQVLALTVTGSDNYSEGTLAVDPSRDRVYVTNPGDGNASVLDAETLEPLATLDGVDQLALDAQSGRVYVAGLSSLRALDAGDYETLAETPLYPAYGFDALAVGPGSGRVYLVTQEASGYLLAWYDAESLQPLSSTPLPGQPESLLPEPDRDRVYLTLSDGEHNLFWVLDRDGNLLEERALGEWTDKAHLALDPTGGRLFLGRDAYGNYGITVLDLETGQELADVPLKQGPAALAWDAGSGRLLVSHTYADRIGTVDVDARKVVAVYPTTLDLVDLAVDAERGHLYVTDTAGRLHVLDSDTDRELATLPAEGRISVDVPHGRFFTGGGGADRVRIFDADRLQQTGEIQTRARPVADAYHGGLYLVKQGIYLASLETMTITAPISDTLPQVPGYSPNPAAVDAYVDPGSGRVFAIINNGVPGSNNGNYLYVYEPVTYQKILTDTERSPWPLDIDPDTGRAYVSRIHLAGRSTSLIEDGREYAARLDSIYGSLRVDPGLGRVYLTAPGSTEGHLLVLDAGNLDVLGGLPIPGQLTIRALDPQRHLLYLATEDGRVQVWSATGGESPPPVAPFRADLPPEGIWRLYRGAGDTPIFTGSLYRSGDEGRSWVNISGNLPQRDIYQLVVSPNFGRDGSLFAVPFATDEGLGVYKSTDAGWSWRMANVGLCDLSVTDLAISPAFGSALLATGDAGSTLFAMTRKQGLFRSIDGGERWESLLDRYRPEKGTYTETPGGVFVSPTYDQDSTLFARHYGLQRSTDGGQSWTRVFPAGLEVALSPAFATDQTLFGWTGSGGLLRSTNGGDSWQAASQGLTLEEYGTGRVLLPADYPTSRTVYLIWTPSSSGSPVQFFRSTDDATIWQRLAGPPPRGATPVELSADGAAFLALDESGRLLRWPVDTLDWQPIPPPILSQLAVTQLVLSPGFGSISPATDTQDQTLFALTERAGILRSDDAGLTWTETGFPLRMTSSFPEELVALAPDTLLVGTPLGLYRLDGDGPWAPVGGGLPPEIAISSPQVGEDGSLHLLAGRDDEQYLYLSTDGGRTWTQPIPGLPRAVVKEDLRFSPNFATDHTAFISLNWDGLWRTTGGAWEQIGLPDGGTLVALHLSPAFDRDGLLFARLEDNSLWRSTDDGETWTRVSGPWGDEAPTSLTPGSGYLLDAITFSPDYAGDGVLLTRAGNVVYRSTDRGTTWTKVLDVGFPLARATFSPGYARDGTVYLLHGQVLYRSIDRGQSWLALSSVPWSESEDATLHISPTFAQDNTLLASTFSGLVYASTDGGQSWHDAGSGLPASAIRQVLFSSNYASDGLLYLVSVDRGLYKQVGRSAWLPVTESAPPPTPAPPPPTSAPPPTQTPTPLTCPTEPVYFYNVWQQTSDLLGCPQQVAEQVFFAEQPFERARLIWDSRTVQIYVLLDSGTWQAFDDTWSSDQPESDPSLVPPDGLLQPQRGFGKVWREELGGAQATTGWALEGERPVNGWRQRFERGLLVWTDARQGGAEDAGTAYLLYDDGTWQAIPVPAP